MKYYITANKNNEITGGYIDTINKDIPKNAIEVSKSIWNQRLNDSSLNCYEDGKFIVKDFRTDIEIQEQELQKQRAEALKYLSDTDHKFYNGYKPKEGEDLVKIERLRDEAREFIRANEGDE